MRREGGRDEGRSHSVRERDTSKAKGKFASLPSPPLHCPFSTQIQGRKKGEAGKGGKVDNSKSRRRILSFPREEGLFEAQGKTGPSLLFKTDPLEVPYNKVCDIENP